MAMTRDAANWQLLQDLFHLAEVTPASDRERVLTQRCPDENLRRRAMSIFDAANIEDALETPLQDAGQESILSGKIGPYSLIRHIGTGGIGAVYLVERLVGGALQRSALKVLAPHSAGPSFVERFHREQHILASLDHPNITRMLDAGLSDRGQPYLVMEFVDGVHLDVYCDTHNLAIPDRLQLFLRVCDAVAYAHRNLIVHLDLKPSNILVTAEGTVKLLDFGTSKLIQPDSLLTTTVMATPAYASPEQLRNEPVTTSCDVYALGAVLFELLAGARPGRGASVAIMIERAIREQEADRLPDAVSADAAEHRGLSESRLRQLLAGDLATIAQKCLNPRPKDRYPSVDSLTVDIQRYLSGRPVLARPQTTWYRMGKFVRRNRVPVAATLFVVIALVAAVAYAGWRQEQAVREGERAMQMQTFMYRLFKLANSNYTGKPAATVPEFLQLGVKMLPEYIKNPADLRQAQLGLAESMYENDDLDNAQGVLTQTIASAKAANDFPAEAESEAFSGNIAYLQGKMDLGESLTAHALEVSRKPGVPPAVRAWSQIFFAWNRDNNGYRSDDNVSLLQSAVKICRDNNLSPRETADALYTLGEDLELRGRLDEAEQAFNQALQVYGQDPFALCDQSEVYGDLAYVNEMRGNVEATLPLYQRAYEGYSKCSGAESRGALTEVDAWAGALLKLGRSKEALRMMESAIPTWRKMLGSSPELSEPLYYLAKAYVQTGHFEDAEKSARELVEIQTGKVAPTDRRFGASHLIWAEALVGQHRDREALPHAEIADKLLAAGAISPGAKRMGAEAHQLLAQIQSSLSK
jgi:serine/threonine protein kinase/tetratricopeptide (TPR) repeat protein